MTFCCISGLKKCRFLCIKVGQKNYSGSNFVIFVGGGGSNFVFLVQGGGGQFWPFFLGVEFWQFCSQGGQVWFIFCIGGVKFWPFCIEGQNGKIYLQGVPKRPFCFIGGLENGTFLYSTSLKCHFVAYGGLENTSFLYRGYRKCCFWIVGLENVFFCIGDYENAISLYRGKECIGGQILAYFGNFCIL